MGLPAAASGDPELERKTLAQGDPARGEVLASLGSCGACHTAEGGAPYAGGYAIVTNRGTFYGPNLTPDPVHGIGTWDYGDFVKAMTRGRADGHALWPAFPYTSFTTLRDQELRDLWAWLQTVEPVAEPDRKHDLPPLVGRFSALGLWRALYFRKGTFEEDPAQDAAWNMGAYLAEGIGHCGECHSPRNALGAVKGKHPLSGQGDPPEPAPNITPAGIGSWSHSDLTYFLESGMTPEGDVVGGEMARIVEEGTGRLSPEERVALATWLMSLEPWPEAAAEEAPAPEEDQAPAEDEPWM